MLGMRGVSALYIRSKRGGGRAQRAEGAAIVRSQTALCGNP